MLYSFTESRSGDGSEVVSTEREEMQQQNNMNDDPMFMQMVSAAVHSCLYFGMLQKRYLTDMNSLSFVVV